MGIVLYTTMGILAEKSNDICLLCIEDKKKRSDQVRFVDMGRKIRNNEDILSEF